MSWIHTENRCLSSQAAKILYLIPCTKIQRWPLGIPAALKPGQGAKESPFHVLLGPLRSKEKKTACRASTMKWRSGWCHPTVEEQSRSTNRFQLDYLSMHFMLQKNFTQVPELSAEQNATNGKQKTQCYIFLDNYLNGSFCLFWFLVFPTTDYLETRKLYCFILNLYSTSFDLVKILGLMLHVQVVNSPQEAVNSQLVHSLH